ncbi:MAG: transposase [Candidatus Theseobacter exili]|nr:transposase [Candidatus Theseobacter exili]
MGELHKQFKIEAVRRSFEPGKTAAEVARELDIKVTQLYKWREEFERKQGQAFPKSGKSAQEGELETLRRENKRLKQERDILKKA